MIILGDAAKVLNDFNNESIDCVITSPPYWGLRDYKTEQTIWDSKPDCDHEWNTEITNRGNLGHDSGHGTKQTSNSQGIDYHNRVTYSDFCSKCNAWRGQFGLEPTFQLYINHLVQIFDDVKRVQKKEGTCWVVIGDTYANTPVGLFNGGGAAVAAPSRKFSMGTSGIIDKTGQGVQQKSLIMIPQRFAIAMVDHGWILRNDIIWYKPNCMPSSATDRFTVDYEHIFFFTKSQNYYFETQYEPSTDWANSIPHWHNGTAKYLQVQHRGSNFANPPNPLGRIKRTVWKIATKPYPEAHFAVFPEELIRTPILAGCPEGGIVLDPFAGSGTTLKAAHQLGRKWVGIEINPDYVQLAKKRLTPYVQQQRLDQFTVERDNHPFQVPTLP